MQSWSDALLCERQIRKKKFTAGPKDANFFEEQDGRFYVAAFDSESMDFDVIPFLVRLKSAM